MKRITIFHRPVWFRFILDRVTGEPQYISLFESPTKPCHLIPKTWFTSERPNLTPPFSSKFMTPQTEVFCSALCVVWYFGKVWKSPCNWAASDLRLFKQVLICSLSSYLPALSCRIFVHCVHCSIYFEHRHTWIQPKCSRKAMPQLHLSDQQVYCLLRCVLCYMIGNTLVWLCHYYCYMSRLRLR